MLFYFEVVIYFDLVKCGRICRDGLCGQFRPQEKLGVVLIGIWQDVFRINNDAGLFYEFIKQERGV